mgnify:CR=1 FL=1
MLMFCIVNRSLFQDWREIYWSRPPKAEVRGSNPLECAISSYFSILSFTAPLEQTLDDMKTMANAVKDMSDRIDLRFRKSLQPTDKAKKKTSKKSKGIAKAKPFPSVKPPQPSVSNAAQQATPNSCCWKSIIYK